MGEMETFTSKSSGPFVAQVFDGDEVLLGAGRDFPAALLYGKILKGSGSVIGDRWILTAAHLGCTDRVVIGRTNLLDTSQGAEFPVVNCKRPTDYDEETLENDVALVEIEPNGHALDSIEMAKDDAWRSATSTVTIMGWGLSCHGGSNILCKADVDLMSHQLCKATYQLAVSVSHVITEDVMCTLTNKNRATSQDSGGPVVARSGGKELLVGVISSGKASKLPDRHMSVDRYATWVSGLMAGTGSSEPCC